MNKLRNIATIAALGLAACSTQPKEQSSSMLESNLTREEATYIADDRRLFGPAACEEFVDSLNSYIGRMPQQDRKAAVTAAADYLLKADYDLAVAGNLAAVTPQPSSIRSYRESLQGLHNHYDENLRYAREAMKQYLSPEQTHTLLMMDCGKW